MTKLSLFRPFTLIEISIRGWAEADLNGLPPKKGEATSRSQLFRAWEGGRQERP